MVGSCVVSGWVVVGGGWYVVVAVGGGGKGDGWSKDGAGRNGWASSPSWLPFYALSLTSSPPSDRYSMDLERRRAELEALLIVDNPQLPSAKMLPRR
ncbi:hypothetical protein Ccrd_004555 [Cynara cardunculus var. scolymus]|uniref:Uncharacterized protein n=1 Tax=Cynara cardunculus var. scolymus TaxID=59895 RepID=A0A118JVN1_CYNCS|nr:hypothetical protein Ccrd_004555 [Cynara cardunculus var. scolymus]